jgi:hypothetical protein
MYFMASMIPEEQGRRVTKCLVADGFIDLTGEKDALAQMKKPKTFRVLQPSRSVSGYISIETQRLNVAATLLDYIKETAS